MSNKQRKRMRWQSAWLNNTTWNNIYTQLKELAINGIKWENLPDTIDPRWLELGLFDRGNMVYFNDEIMGDLCLWCDPGGGYDVYNEPKQRVATANNGYIRYLTRFDSVIIWNNYLRTTSKLVTMQYATRLYEIQRAIDVNVKAQKTPVMILSSEEQRLTMKNLYMQYDGNEPFIFGDKTMTLEDVKALKTDAPYVADKLLTLYNAVFNQFLALFGYENTNQDKKERLVAGEVGSNYGWVEAQRTILLNARRQAVEKINRMFGTKINVRFNSDVPTMLNSVNIENNEVVDDGEVYNTGSFDHTNEQ